MDQSLIEIATNASSIRAVHLRGSHIRCKDDVLPPYFDEELDLTPQFRGRPGSKIDVLGFQDQPDAAQHRIAICHFQVGVRLVDNASLTTTDPVDDEAVYLEITADFSAEYDVRDGIDDATLRPALEEFARYNAGSYLALLAGIRAGHLCPHGRASHSDPDVSAEEHRQKRSVGSAIGRQLAGGDRGQGRVREAEIAFEQGDGGVFFGRIGLLSQGTPMTETSLTCPVCESGALQPDRYGDTFQHQGNKLVVADLESYRCPECGPDPVFEDQIRRNHARISDARRRADGLLTRE